MHNKMPSIRQQIDSTASEVTTYSRKRVIMRSIINTVILCGRQGIPLRGHQDDRTSLISSPDQNQLFRAVEFPY